LTDLYRLLLGVLCVWRITHLFQAEDGPWNMVARIRRAAGDGQFGRLLDCFYCLSLWVAVLFAWLIGSTVTERVLLWLAFSGGAILAEQGAMRSRPEPASTVQANYKED
jgi:Protein of unknown function (DUF1360)